ncbi:putative transcriptional regulator [Bradyrhizobium sp. USDA 3311]|uniref:helix-turn-helix domain-containing protein n=1 Tax=Bradyrhizobium sp. CCBAU 11361 TaxID=1630812 RepID=UPI00230476E9|nr:helix-turn-helix transcriptional regulator [Bradyrhizobium sp. CCBAU 11361]MDA9489024.1 transcriptional regulator [Bradyrhizobium sp. CCBAU 11361]
MPRWRKPTKEEIRNRRAAISAKARAGELRLPDAVAEMRYALGLSQPEFAKLFKLTTRQIAEIERGVANPTSQTLQKIGRAFGFQIGFVPITPIASVKNMEA